MRESVVFYRSFYEAVKNLPPEEFKRSVQSIMEYGLNGIEPETDGIERTVFLLTKPQIDANNRRYKNGKKGGAKSSQEGTKEEPNDNQEEGKEEPNDNQEGTKAEPNGNQTGGKEEPKDKDKDKDKEKDKEKEKEKEKEKTYTCVFERLWSMYPRKQEKANAYRCYKARLSDGFPEDALITAVKRYADECKKNKTERRYIKLAATFLGPNTPFIDYLGGDGNYDPGTETNGITLSEALRRQAESCTDEFDGF